MTSGAQLPGYRTTAVFARGCGVPPSPGLGKPPTGGSHPCQHPPSTPHDLGLWPLPWGDHRGWREPREWVLEKSPGKQGQRGR